MRAAVTRLVRKLQSSGINSTAHSLWKELYLIEILQNNSLMQKLHSRYEVAPAQKDEFRVSSTSEGGIDSHLPARTWIDKSESFEEMEMNPVSKPELYSYKNSYLCVPPGVGFTTEKKIIRDTFANEIVWNRGRGKTWLPSLIYYHGPYQTDQFLRKKTTPTEFDIDIGIPVLPYWRNYYHWTMECLPKLQWLEHRYCQGKKSPKVLVPSNLSSWMEESLALLDIKNIYRCDADIYTVEELLVPKSPPPSRADCQWIRKQMLARVDKREQTGKRIYISRENANRRRVKNRATVGNILADFGFQSYVLEEMSVKRQVDLFTQAEAIVGPHGAGLTNMIYAPDPVVIELFGEQKKTSYYRLAKLLDFEYRDVCGKSSEVDIIVDTDKLKKTLIQVLPNRTEL